MVSLSDLTGHPMRKSRLAASEPRQEHELDVWIVFATGFDAHRNRSKRWNISAPDWQHLPTAGRWTAHLLGCRRRAFHCSLITGRAAVGLVANMPVAIEQHCRDWWRMHSNTCARQGSVPCRTSTDAAMMWMGESQRAQADLLPQAQVLWYLGVQCGASRGFSCPTRVAWPHFSRISAKGRAERFSRDSFPIDRAGALYHCDSLWKVLSLMVCR